MKTNFVIAGPGESGKSTTLKQMKIIHAEGYSRDDLLERKVIIFSNIVMALTNAFAIIHKEGNALKKLQEWKSIEVLYKSEAMKRLMQDTDDSIIDDGAKYFLDNLPRISAADYVPTLQDVLKCRVRTQGCVQMNFFIKDYIFQVFDVGGQRSQRKKWLHVFDDVHAILFITSLSEYTQTLREDPAVNRMRESLGIFGGICQNQNFKHISIILFMNKIDLFKEKIQKYPINTVFPRYKGPQTFDDSLLHITKRFLRENPNPKRTIYVHNTCATDTQQIQIVIDAVIDTIIQHTMQKIGIQ